MSYRRKHETSFTRWSAAEIEELHVLAAASHSYKEIGQRLGKSRGAISGKCHHLGISTNGSRGARKGSKLSAEHRARISAGRKAAFAVRPYHRQAVRP
jgi:hypothetical protein